LPLVPELPASLTEVFAKEASDLTSSPAVVATPLGASFPTPGN